MGGCGGLSHTVSYLPPRLLIYTRLQGTSTLEAMHDIASELKLWLGTSWGLSPIGYYVSLTFLWYRVSHFGTFLCSM